MLPGATTGLSLTRPTQTGSSDFKLPFGEKLSDLLQESKRARDRETQACHVSGITGPPWLSRFWKTRRETGMGVTRGIWQETLRDDLGLGLVLRVYKNTDQARATALPVSPSRQGHWSPGFPQGARDKLLRNLPSVHRRQQPRTQSAGAAAGEGNQPQTQGPEIPLRTDAVPKCHKVRSNLNGAQS